jgi:hypothetical protein
MRTILLLILVILLISCKTKDNSLYEIDPRTFIENKITLADIADDIRYIRLDNSIPFINFNYELTPDFIYISAKGIGILKFDRQGRLIKKIGSHGRGPGEFIYGINFTVDEKTGNVFVIDRPNITKVYGNNGTFIRDILLNKIGGGVGWGGNIEIFNSLLFFPNSLGQGDSKYDWAFLDTLGNLVAIKENSLPPFQTNAGRNACIYKFENKILYFNYFNDTIFSISSDLDYHAEYIFAQGDHRWPKTGITGRSIVENSAQVYKAFDPGIVFETKRFIVLQYGYLDIGAICFIDKKSKKTFLAFKLDESPTQYTRIRKYTINLINDLDGGMPLKNLNYYFENDVEYLTSLINPLDLIVYVSGDEFKNMLPKYPEKKKELKKLANSLKETDNPVLILVKLKN